MLLETNSITKIFGGLAAVSQFDMSISKGKVVGLIGPNGAGKTTILNLISGFLRPTRGNVYFEGKDITGKPPHMLAEMGIGRTFQITHLFGEFTTFENLVASFYLSSDACFWRVLLNTSRYREREKFIQSQAEEILHILGLDWVRDEYAKNLPCGYQKLLDLGRALAINPKLLLLDEPLSGMSPYEIDLVIKAIKKIRLKGITILLVDHNVDMVMTLCDWIIVMNYGQKIAQGLPEEVRRNNDVIDAYFGGEYNA